MILRNRVIFSDNGTLKDLSEALNNHVSGNATLPIVAAQDYLFLGADAPFNHRWVEVGTANTNAAKVSEIAVWDGTKWTACAEIIDDTLNSAGTIGFSKSGRLAWVPDKNKPGWSRDDTQAVSGAEITGLETVKIYNLFWVRIKFSADMSGTTALSYLGWKFANDEDLYNLKPEFDTTEARERFKTGITTFDQVHFEAAKQVTRDLKSAQVLDSENQVIEWEVLRLPAIYKAAELIYSGYGSDWEKERLLALEEYRRAMKVDLFNVDQNANASLDVYESNFRQGRLNR
jgi:hypothetical protein